MRKPKREAKCDKFISFLYKNNIQIGMDWINIIYIRKPILNICLIFKSDYVTIRNFEFLINGIFF